MALLTTTPGIGPLSAIEILVELQDITRFKTADELAAYLGLTPSQYSSGEHIRMGTLRMLVIVGQEPHSLNAAGY